MLSPNVQEHRQECAPPPLLALEELYDLLVAMFGGEVQGSLAVAVSRLKVNAALDFP